MLVVLREFAVEVFFSYARTKACSKYYETVPSSEKLFFKYYETVPSNEKREIQVPTSYIQDAPSKFFLALRVAQVKEAKGFFSDELHTRTRTWKSLNSARAGLSPQEGDVRRFQKK